MSEQLGLFWDGLPERVRCMSFWSPYGQLIVDGIKTIETRKHTRVAPGWCVVHVAKKIDRAATDRLAFGDSVRVAHAVESYLTWDKSWRRWQCPDASKLLGIVWIGEHRPLVFEDARAACIWEPGLIAYPLSKARRFSHPIENVKGRQGVWYESRERILAGLGAPPP
jgi:hypothetical protein